MAEVVVIGAGLSGTLMAYELLPQLRRDDRLTVISQGPRLSFRPIQPVGRGRLARARRHRGRSAADHEAQGHRLLTQGAKRVHPAGEPDRTRRRQLARLRLSRHRHRPGPRLRRNRGLGPERLHPVHLPRRSRRARQGRASSSSRPIPGRSSSAPCRARRASARPTNSLFILDTELRRRKLRDRVPMTFVTSEPYIGHLGLDGVGDTKGLLESEMRERHIKWITNARVAKVEQGKMTVEEVARGRRGQSHARTCRSPIR